MNKVRNWGVATVATLGALSGNVYAALPTGITAAVDAAEADGLLLVGALAGLGAAIFIIAKLLKRFGVMA